MLARHTETRGHLLASRRPPFEGVKVLGEAFCVHLVEADLWAAKGCSGFGGTFIRAATLRRARIVGYGAGNHNGLPLAFDRCRYRVRVHQAHQRRQWLV
jgi:hypothetical protein